MQKRCERFKVVTGCATSTAVLLERMKRVSHYGSNWWWCICRARESRHRYCQTCFAWQRVGRCALSAAPFGVRT